MQTEASNLAKQYLEDLLTFFGVNTTVEAEQEGDSIELRVESDSSGHLIGHRGETLAALQHMLNMMMRRASTERIYVHIDVGGYRKARIGKLEETARRVAEEVISSGEEKPLPFMSAAERRHIHGFLNDVEGVESESRGEGNRRRLVVKKAS